jgi:hypothetical protein
VAQPKSRHNTVRITKDFFIWKLLGGGKLGKPLTNIAQEKVEYEENKFLLGWDRGGHKGRV